MKVILLLTAALLTVAFTGCTPAERAVQGNGGSESNAATASSSLDTTDASTPVSVPGIPAKTIGELYELMLDGSVGHDGALWLKDHGDASSVPALLKVLEDNRPPDGQKAVVCTYGHAVDALRVITGENELWTYGEWQSWWNRQRERAAR